MDTTRIKLRRPHLRLLMVVMVRILRRRRLRLQEQARRLRHRLWMQRVRRRRHNRSRFVKFYTELRSHADKLYNYCHMSIPVFDELLRRLRTSLTLQNTVLGEYVRAEENLLITLRFLATGEAFASMHQQFCVSTSIIARIVKATCKTMWRELQPTVMPSPTLETWLKVAAGFETAASFPNCIGAVDARHLRARQPLDTDLGHFGHNKYFSVLVLAVADANCKFIAIDVGTYDNTGACRVLESSLIQQQILQDQMSLPTPRPFPGTTDPVPLVMVSDNVFGVTPPLLCPYPWRGLDNRRRMFNSRLSRACRFVEGTFGIMASRWKVVCSDMRLDVDTVESVIKACCVLHNYVCECDGEEVDAKTQMPYTGTVIDWNYNRPLNNGLHVRDSFADYFASPEGAVIWQFSCLANTDLH